MTLRSETVSFRLPPDLLRLLDDQCLGSNLSRGDWARSTVVSRLTTPDPTLLEAELQQFHDQLDRLVEQHRLLERRLCYLLFIVLTRIGDCSAQEARDIIRTQLLEREEG